MNPVYILQPYFPEIHFSIIPSMSTKLLYAYIMSPVHATCPTYLMLHDFIILIFCEMNIVVVNDGLKGRFLARSLVLSHRAAFCKKHT
jgi:hypothetical protein